MFNYLSSLPQCLLLSYHLIFPLCRYDLHEWLFTLHNGLENFKKKLQKAQERRQSEHRAEGEQPRSRTNTAESQQPRPRASTAEREGQHLKPSATAGHTPPYRRAPPPPRERPQRRKPNREDGAVANASANGGEKHDTSSPRRKPVRPAPVLPGRPRQNSTSGGGPGLSQEVPLSQNNLFGNEVTTPTVLSLPSHSYSPAGAGRDRTLSQEGYGTLESDREGYGTMESGQHVIMDLNISQNDRDPLSSDAEDMLSPIHARSASDSLVLMQQVSSSLPEMLDEAGNSTSPETVEEGAEQKKKSKNDDLSTKNPGHGFKHTRHLSLLGGSKKEVRGGHAGRSRKKPRRGGSMKQRSRSPPNLPPPPPPPTDFGMERSSSSSQDQDLGNKGLSNTPASTASLGFSEVLNTISDIDQQLDHLTESFTTTNTIITPSQPPSRAPPPPPTEMVTATLTFGQADLGPSPVPQAPSPVAEAQHENEDFCEEEWMCDGPPNEDDQPDSSSRSGDTRPPDQEILIITPPRPPVRVSSNGTSAEKPSKKQHRVMFKEEVEDIPNYEPRVDQQEDVTTSSSDEETEIDPVPVGVAAIKLKLFGKQEKKATRYKKEGGLSPRHTHPENMFFSEEYFNTDVMDDPNQDNVDDEHDDYDPAPVDHAQYDQPHYEYDGNVLAHQDNTNNNNSEEESVVSELVSSSPPDPADDDIVKGEDPAVPAMVVGGERRRAPTHNTYESPWDEKPISKYRVIGIVRRTVTPPGAGGQVKEKTPPPVATKKNARTMQNIQFAEVSMKETPKPFATEVRNVHSLERNQLKKGRQLSPPTSPPTQLSPPSPAAHLSPTGTSTSDDGDSLLASISSTLQVTSRYGSDSLLNSGGEVFPQGNTGGSGSEKTTQPSTSSVTGLLKTSSRGELEKIRAAHRKDFSASDPLPSSSVSTPISPLTQTTRPDQHSSPQLYSAPSSVNSTPYRSGVLATTRAKQQQRGMSSSRMTASLDGLERDTEVTYDTQSHARILRSLV